jgi:hypothetical protein
MLDITVPKIGLQRPRVVSSIGESVAASVPEHVGVGLKLQLGLGPCSLDHAGKTSRGEGRSPFRGENERRLGSLLAPEPSQGAQFVP